MCLQISQQEESKNGAYGLKINHAVVIISTMIAIFAFMLLGFASDVVSKNLVKNNYSAKSLMREDYKSIDTTLVIDNGGGVQVMNTNYEVIFSEGLNTILKDKLTTAEFTDFLIMSKSKGIPYSISIEYNAKEKLSMHRM